MKNFLFLLTLLSPVAQAFPGVWGSGTSSLINIPVARVMYSQKITVGAGYIDNRVAYLTNGRFDNFPLYITIGYLPRLEFSAGVVFVPGEKSYDGSNTYKDGVVSLQFLAFKEGRFLPAIALGARDIYSFILLNTSYIVASKTLVRKTFSRLVLHWGYAGDIFDQHVGVLPQDRNLPVGHTLVGMFGGIEIKWLDSLSYMMEFDTQKINTGIRFKLNENVECEFDLFNMSNFGGGFQINFGL
ncbi:hypothetical protein GF337_11565 [candidate division KSB1 bacterium]|nr:hypothetical protein [candidate division KSB1 bacterium]